jgi:hypothetical protein
LRLPFIARITVAEQWRLGEARGRFLAPRPLALKLCRMANRNRRREKKIVMQLTQSQELDQDTYEHLAEAAGLIADAEAVFLRLAESAW